VYEVRGLGEVDRESRDPSYRGSEGYALSVRLETQAATEADAVITITDALRLELIRRGIEPGKIMVVPNGVDTDRFQLEPRDEELAAELGVAGKTVVGFVGTLVAYEGLDLLLRASARLAAESDDFRVLIVGSGTAQQTLHDLSTELGLDRVVTFTGRVPHAEVSRYLSLIDVTPFPRRALPVTEMVSPLKPLESMATGSVVIASSVAALAEMVEDGRTGLVFEKESLDDLTRALRAALDDDALREQLVTNGRAWVEAQRSWTGLSRTVERCYASVLAGVPVGDGR
jgi:glycosyltransferase involved in cell wall biosynthesis